MEDEVQLEFDLAFGVRKNDVVLKYMLDNALEKSKDEIKQILLDYRVPLVQCSRCIVSGDLNSHGSYFTNNQERARNLFLEPLPAAQTQIDKATAAPDQIVTPERLDDWLKDGADLNLELSNAVTRLGPGVESLLAKGADINKLNLQGLAPLHTAARQRDSDMIALLLAHGADVNRRDADGWPAIVSCRLPQSRPVDCEFDQGRRRSQCGDAGWLHGNFRRHR